MKQLMLVFILLFVIGCELPRKPSEEINNCVSIHYQELNCGTFSYITVEGICGSRTYQLEGVYKRNNDGTVTLTGGGNKRIRSGLVWHTVKIDPNMRQHPRYLHPNCRLCAKP